MKYLLYFLRAAALGYLAAALPLAVIVFLAGCAHIPAPSCANAPKVRAAAALALQALERVCPMEAR